ncbi:MAG: YeeE/YedE family protein [Halobacteriovoraceae bacterium]|nr:YeeE/YedE family protein [Halobacteriovoraceae bacterium]
MTSMILLPLLGGILIAISTTLMLAQLGKITGISGIVSHSLSQFKLGNDWRYGFLIGLILGGFVIKMLYPQFFSYPISENYLKLAIAGLLVGYGTRLGHGCTSGHGVCGMARVAKRSIVATFTFMLFGIITVAIEGLL